MKRDLPKYIERGGTQAAIAKAWNVSPAYISKLTKDNPEDFVVEFNVMNPRHVLGFRRKARLETVERGEVVYFDKTEGRS